MTTDKNKFCFIYGSFLQTMPYLRRPDSDIDVMCNEMDEWEAKRALEKKFGKIPRNVQIGVRNVWPNNGVIKFDSCYWQNKKPFEVYNQYGVKYNFMPKCARDIACFLRDPDKTQFGEHMKGNEFKFLVKGYRNEIERHYGKQEYDREVSKLSGDKKDFFEMIKSRTITGSNKCKIRYGQELVFDENNKTVSGDGFNMGIRDFFNKCFK
jgi:hypothetical protein